MGDNPPKIIWWGLNSPPPPKMIHRVMKRSFAYAEIGEMSKKIFYGASPDL
jgi:hypothetical protein